MERVFNYQITAEYEDDTIEMYLRGREYSRHILAHLKRTPDGILRNGTWARTNEQVKAGDSLTITLLEHESSPNIIPVAMPLSIVYEDEDILVLDKPADTPIHPSQNNYDNTLANGVISYYQKQHIPFVYRCINRLDRDTTGLLVIAKHMLSSTILSAMMKHREIHREYLALVTGKTPSSGIIEAPIGRVPGSTIERMVDENGEYAKTNYRLVSYANNRSLVSLILGTGRTHQIRVHMKHIGHPLLGDYIYNPEEKSMCRQALHSHKLSFGHPITKEPLEFVSPLPADMAELINESENCNKGRCQ